MDSDLVIQAQHGDQHAFEALAIASHNRLHRVAHGILRDAHLAEDATQQALLDIWRHIGRLRDPEQYEGWSYRIVVHACYAEAKRRPTTVPEAPTAGVGGPVAADAFGSVIDRDLLERGFARISPDHRAVLVLHYLLDMTLERMAEVLDLPVGTVNSRMSRAMRSLRLALEADGPAGALGALPEVVR